MSEAIKMTYKEAFNILNNNVQKLRNNEEGEDIDSLVEIMQKSTDAYKLCMERIEAVKSAMEQYSSQLEAVPTIEQTMPVSTQKNAAIETSLFDDDVPF